MALIVIHAAKILTQNSCNKSAFTRSVSSGVPLLLQLLVHSASVSTFPRIPHPCMEKSLMENDSNKTFGSNQTTPNCRIRGLPHPFLLLRCQKKMHPQIFHPSVFHGSVDRKWFPQMLRSFSVPTVWGQVLFWTPWRSDSGRIKTLTGFLAPLWITFIFFFKFSSLSLTFDGNSLCSFWQSQETIPIVLDCEWT